MKSRQTGSFATGLVIGLLLGLAVALAVALYITKAPVPFINKLPQRSAEQDAAEFERNKAWDPNAPLAGKHPARPAKVASGTVDEGATAAGAASQATTPAAALPARDPAAILAAQPSAPPAPAAPAPATAAPVATPAAAPAAATAAVPAAAIAVATVFFVQAGAYTRAEDADAQRAKLALLGLAAKVSEREQSGRTVYRVRLGPFDLRAPAEDAQAKLAGAGIEANLVRVER